jgi:diadenosine tetraphosphate (Ap4A) HIT family hydrolase
MNNFQLDSRLASDGDIIIGLNLSQVLFVNNALFPWVILIPKRDQAKEIIDLNVQDRTILIEEISLVSEAMKEVFSPDKLNVAALGNVVPQLHIHVIARYKTDTAWPKPVFGNGKELYSEEKYQHIKTKLIAAIDNRRNETYHQKPA